MKFLFFPPASFQVSSPDWARRVLTEDRTLDAASLDIVAGDGGGCMYTLEVFMVEKTIQNLEVGPIGRSAEFFGFSGILVVWRM